MKFLTKIYVCALCLISIALLSACDSGSKNLTLHGLYGTDITGADFAQSLKLTDHTGKVRQLEDFHGKVVALFFGYTHCPDVCPTTMLEMAKAMKLLGSTSDNVQVLFVTLDPERDTPAVLAQYVPNFDKRFLGLYGSAEEIATTANNFKIFYSKQQVPGRSGYSIDHSAGTYVFDKNGKIRIYLKYGQKPEEIASDLKQLL